VADGYVHGYATNEQVRLVAQAEHWRNELILDGTRLSPGTRLLEIGCGVGAVLGVLGTPFPGITLAGVDVEERQVLFARSHLARLGLGADLRCADALALPYEDASLDHGWLMWFLEHVSDPVAALREARRVLVGDGALTAIEVDYNSTWATPTSDAIETLFGAVAAAMDRNGRSDAGSWVEGWLIEAGFGTVDAGERRLLYTGTSLARQLPYVIAVVESTLAELASASDATEAQLRAGVADLRGSRRDSRCIARLDCAQGEGTAVERSQNERSLMNFGRV
jgi:ubiquinone/menaquinone biosynthesis C-methylase UbiE